MTEGTILVTGATGTQGAAVVAAFMAGGWRVRALVRAPDRADARALHRRGVERALGVFADEGSLVAACRGVDAVFSVQPAVVDEVETARRIVAAACAAGVVTMIHTSVSSTGWRTGLPPGQAGWSRTVARQSGSEACCLTEECSRTIGRCLT